MARPAPEPGQEPYTLSFSVPKPIADRIKSEFEPGYGAQAQWFRQVVSAWWDGRSLREENARLRARIVVVEGTLHRVQQVLRDAA